MKFIAGIILFLLCGCTLVQKPWVPLPCACENEIHGDSGYVSVKTGSRLLISQGFSDSIQDKWGDLAPDVSTGKYYLDRKTGHYLACVLNYHGQPVLFELKANEEGNEVIRAEQFPHGNHGCCWENIDQGFGKMGNFFYLRHCGTGSQYCAGYLYVFRQIPDAETRPGIWSSLYTTMGGITTILQSTFEMQDSTLVMHYDYRKTYYRYTRLFNIRIKKNEKERADVRFSYTNGAWIAEDSTYLERFK